MLSSMQAVATFLEAAVMMIMENVTASKQMAVLSGTVSKYSL